MDYQNPTVLERVAIHEAGHCVVTTLSPLVSPVESVVLQFDVDGVTGGRTEMLLPDGPHGVPLLRQRLGVFAAGRLAELLAFGCHGGLSHAGDAALAAVVEAQLGEADARAAVDDASALLAKHWGAVHAVAEGLLGCGSMPGELVRALIEAAPRMVPPLVASRIRESEREFFEGFELAARAA